MNKPINMTIAKGVFGINEQYSQKQIAKREEEITRTHSLFNIYSLKPEEVYIQQATKVQKIAALLLKNTLRAILKQKFKQMLSRFLFKRIAIKLIITKFRRNVQTAFLTIKNYVDKSSKAKLLQFYSKQTQVRLLVIICKKIYAKNMAYAFFRLSRLSVRGKKLELISTILTKSMANAINQLYYSEFFSRLRLNSIRQYDRNTALVQMDKITKRGQLSMQRYSFDKLIDTILYWEFSDRFEMRKTKNVKMAEVTTNRKQTLAQLRQQIKTIKVEIDKQKSAKHQLIQQRKRVSNASKIAMADLVKKFDKQFAFQDMVTKDVSKYYFDRRRLQDKRQMLKARACNSFQRCKKRLFSISAFEGDILKNLLNSMPQIIEQIKYFSQSQNSLFKLNLNIQKLIELYQKRESYNYQAEYYVLQNENMVIKQTIRCFIRQLYEEYIWLDKKISDQQ